MGSEKNQTVPEVASQSSLEDGIVANGYHEHDAAFEKKVLRKVDFWLVGFYSLVYIFRVIDSSNYSNAAITNLENGTNIKKQLHFSANEWA